MKQLDVRLGELSDRYELPAEAAGQLALVLAELVDEPASLTSVRDPLEGVERHVEDSLTALDVRRVREARTISDVGAGAGFPGLALAAALPAATVHLVESVERKCAFLDRVTRIAGLTNVEVVRSRAEDWQSGLGGSDVVTARALAPLPVLVEYAAPLLREGGMLVAWKSVPEAAEVRAGDEAAAITGMTREGVVELAPRSGGVEQLKRRLYVYLKVQPTPERFPRRTGVARKRPLAS